ncbi:MAG: efflux RND transporter periplasmic adaptor subunit [Planctomycetota bacterium]
MGKSKPEQAKPSGGRRAVVVIVAAAALVVIILYQAGVFTPGHVSAGQTPVEAGQMPPGQTIEVQPVEVPVFYHAVGVVRSRTQIEVAPRIIARVLRVTVRSGDRVKEGELLVKLDARDLQAAVEEAEQQVEAARARIKASNEAVRSAQAALDLARQEEVRIRKLFDDKVATRQQLDQVTARRTQAEAALEQARQNDMASRAALASAEAAMRRSQTNLGYATIESPIDGVVGQREVDTGDMASPGNVLLEVFDPTRLELEIPIRESLAREVKLETDVTVHVPAIEKTITGKVTEVVPSVDPGSRTFLVKVDVATVPGMMPGMYANLRYLLRREQALVIPAAARSRTGQVEYVTEVTDQGPRRRMVQTVPVDEDRLRVVTGLDPGARIRVPKK